MNYEMDGRDYPFDSDGCAGAEISTLGWKDIPEKIVYTESTSRIRIVFVFHYAEANNGDVAGWYYKDLDNRERRILIIND